MTEDERSELERIVKEVKNELNPDNRGYETSEAAALIFFKAKQGCGYLTNAMTSIARMGARIALKEYVEQFSAERECEANKTNKKLAKAMTSTQRDFSEEVPGFEWTFTEVAMNEGSSAIRKVYGYLDYQEANLVYGLLAKKGNETLASAARVKTVIDSHPEWKARPRKVMFQILGIKSRPGS